MFRSSQKMATIKDKPSNIRKVLYRLEYGGGRPNDLDLLLDVGDNICPGLNAPFSQTTICPLGPSAVSPIVSLNKYFRDEVQAPWFAHFLKVMMRDRVGAFTTPSDVEEALNRWLTRYVVSNESASEEMKARYPLREGRAQVREIDGKPGPEIYVREEDTLDSSTQGFTVLEGTI